MRVALVYDNLTESESLGRDRLALARGLAASGVEVHCYCLPGRGNGLPSGVAVHEIRPLVLSSGGRVANAVQYGSFAWAATRALRRERRSFDVVDVSGTTAWEHDVLRVHAVQRAERDRWPARGGRTFRGARLRAALAPLAHPKVGVAQAIQRRQLAPGRFRRISAVTDEVKRDLIAWHRVSETEIDVVPYSVDLDRIAAAEPAGVRQRLDIPDDAVLAVFVGHDFERKGLAEAVAAVARVEDVHLVVVGGGPADVYRAEATTLGAGDRVHFVGSRADPERYLVEAHLLLLPTREDVWGIAVVEAMAAGLPVLITEAAGTARLIEQASAGVLVPPGSAEALRRELAALAASPDRRRALGVRGRRAARRFGHDAFVEASLRVYEQALS
jgi:glycosyltransferase involved in cell wall biosynthesis